MTATLRRATDWRTFFEPEQPHDPVALGGGLAAAVAAGMAMWLLRSTLQVRSIPERLLEWVLLFVPLDVFEGLLQRFGFSAKRYALFFGIAVMLGALTWLGWYVLRRRWSLPALLGGGVGLWLFTMLVILPLTSAGFFAMSLLDGKRETILGYLGGGLLVLAGVCQVSSLVGSPLRRGLWR